jgi:hypothetical protein
MSTRWTVSIRIAAPTNDRRVNSVIVDKQYSNEKKFHNVGEQNTIANRDRPNRASFDSLAFAAGFGFYV